MIWNGLLQGSGEEAEEWECVACGEKTFRSEAAWNSHERSKKHMKAVERLRSEMEEDEKELELGEEAHEDHNDQDTDEPLVSEKFYRYEYTFLATEPDAAAAANPKVLALHS